MKHRGWLIFQIIQFVFFLGFSIFLFTRTIDGHGAVQVLNKGVSTCGDCSELETCPTVGAILENNPAALENLKG